MVCIFDVHIMDSDVDRNRGGAPDNIQEKNKKEKKNK